MKTPTAGASRRPPRLLALVLTLAAAACGSNNPPPDGGGTDSATESGSPDTGRPNDAGAPDAAVSLAGHACTTNADCGGATLMCDTASFPGYGFCSATCTEAPAGASAATMEATMCGGANSTCLTLGDPPDSNSFCVQSCNPSAHSGPTACATGYICTGGAAYSNMNTVDATGCLPFCTMDSQCSGGMHCNPRTGACDARGANPMGIPDGAQCDTSASPDRCRGVCFAIQGAPGTLGICGSYLDLTVSMDCPDNPDTIGALGATGDNLGLCLFQTCTDDCGCAAPLHCITGGALGSNGVCGWVDSSDPGEMTTPPASGSCSGADGGAADGGTDASARDGGAADSGSGDASMDGGASDVATGG